MTEITRVPLQPIAKGALGKLWLGVAAGLLVAGGIAWAAMPSAVKVDTVVEGKGMSPTRDDVALINYKGMLDDGKVFDEGKQVPLALSDMIPGFTQALEQMQRGGKYKVKIPAELGYGNEQAGEIPPNSDLTFDIELLDFKSKAEIEQQQRMMQQLQQMQQMQGGAPGAPGAMPPGAMPEGAMPPGAVPPQP
ncbi:MAG: FKBP-type peptidyl-prolyl cis-trans isomerase [Novosphingobium sp.]|nr:FKBP-type peptidyl-prolyl cis-trans isomerase [Novosphingobium sp.]